MRVLEASTQKDMYEISVSFIKLVQRCMVKIKLVAETKCLTAPGKFIENQECQRTISKISSYVRKLDFTSLVVSFRVAR